MATFQFEIITLAGKPYSGKVKSLVVPGEKGYFGVLVNHASFVSNCVPGKLKIKEEENEIFLTPGLLLRHGRNSRIPRKSFK